MSYVAIASLILISFIGGALNEVAKQSDETTRTVALDDADTLVSLNSVLTISDAEQNQNPSNADVSAPGIVDRNWWNFLLTTISWDFVYLSGQLQIIRQFMWVITISIFVWVAITIGSGLLGSIRNAGN